MVRRVFCLVIFMLGGQTVAFAAGGSASLEERLWTEDGEDFLRVKSEIVRKIQEDPQSVYDHYLLANVYLRQFLQAPMEEKWLQRAIKIAKQAIYLDVNSELGYLALADTHSSVGDSVKTRDILRIFSHMVNIKKSWRYYLLQAKVSLTPETTSHSLRLLERAISMPEALPTLIVPYVIVILDAKYRNVRGELLRRVNEWNERAPHNLFDQYLASIHVDMGEHQLAYDIYVKMLKKDPTNVEARRNRAIIAYRDMGKEQEALEIFSSLLASKELSSLDVIAVSIHQGIIYLRQNKGAEAGARFLSAFLAQPELSQYEEDILLNLVVATYREQAKYRELSVLLEKLSVERPGRAVYHTLLGDVRADHLKDYRKAVTAYRDAIVLDPYRGGLYTALGLVHYHLQEFEEALAMFGQAQTLNAYDVAAIYNEACVYALLNRNEEALSSLQRAIELDDSLRDHARQDADFDKIRSMPEFAETLD